MYSKVIDSILSTCNLDCNQESVLKYWVLDKSVNHYATFLTIEAYVKENPSVKYDPELTKIVRPRDCISSQAEIRKRKKLNPTMISPESLSIR